MNMKNHHFLLIDIGNTNTHVGSAKDKGKIKDIEFSTRPGFERALSAFIDSRPAHCSAMISSVVPKINSLFKKTLIKSGIKEIHFISAQSKLPVGIRYPHPETIGPDRLANSAGAVVLYGPPCIVIDFGTAVTFDIINPKNEYIGGVIAPGLAAMTDYLYHRTALLPKISLKEPSSPIGKSTIAAMTIGAVTGYRGLIKEILGSILDLPDMKKATIVATGGYSSLIARKLPQITHVNPMLTLEGLRQVALTLGK